MSSVVERSLAPELSLVDVDDDLLWHRDGSLTVVYRLTPFHEPGMDDDDFNAAALIADNVWSGLPEGTSYQFIVCVDHRQAVERIRKALSPIAVEGATSRLFEAFRSSRLAGLLERDVSPEGRSLLQERTHYLAATFRPTVVRAGAWQRLAARLRRVVRRGGSDGSFARIYEQILHEAATFERRVHSQLSQQGLDLRRCQTPELVSLLYELLNPTAGERGAPDVLSTRNRSEPGMPRSIVEEMSYLGTLSPVWSLLDDDVLVRRDHLAIGDRVAAVVSLKELPDATEPGMIAPLLRLSREKYRLVYRVDIPARGLELAQLRTRMMLADGMRLDNMIVDTDRSDPHAEAVGTQTREAAKRIIASTERIFGVALQVVLMERTAEALEEAVQETLGAMARARGLRGYRETYMLKKVFLSLLPGAPPTIERRRRTLTPETVDMMPVYDSRPGEGAVPFLTPNNAVVFFDPFASPGHLNNNVLITGVSGAGKSVLAQMILSGVEIAHASRGQEGPYTFILDNGASYERYMRLRDDGRYVAFDFKSAPGVDIFRWSPDDGDLAEHISRLEWLLLDFLHVDQANRERFERKKAAVEEALIRLYAGDGPRTFEEFGRVLREVPEGEELCPALFPYGPEGKFARLFAPNDALALADDVRAVCYDFMGLKEHADYAFVALRLVIFQIRRFAARAARRGRRTFLLIDESWQLLDGKTDGGVVGAHGARFMAESVRMGRKEGIAVMGLSQELVDFADSAYGAAIINNSSTKLVGSPGAGGLRAAREILNLTARQVEQIQKLASTPRYHEFLMIQDMTSHVIRVPLDSFARWVFTTSKTDRERIAEIAESRPDLRLFEQLQLLANRA